MGGNGNDMNRKSSLPLRELIEFSDGFLYDVVIVYFAIVVASLLGSKSLEQVEQEMEANNSCRSGMLVFAQERKRA